VNVKLYSEIKGKTYTVLHLFENMLVISTFMPEEDKIVVWIISAYRQTDRQRKRERLLAFE
jgi:hypothetical protein